MEKKQLTDEQTEILAKIISEHYIEMQNQLMRRYMDEALPPWVKWWKKIKLKFQKK